MVNSFQFTRSARLSLVFQGIAEAGGPAIILTANPGNVRSFKEQDWRTGITVRPFWVYTPALRQTLPLGLSLLLISLFVSLDS
jgi:hypothetical protein